MNKDKIGNPYRFPNSLIRLQAIWHARNIPYRMVEGITRQLYRMARLPDYNHYSTINRRTNQLDLKLKLPENEALTLFCDGSGYQAISGGEYLREKYGKKNRQWVHVVILGDPKTKEPVSFQVNIIPDSEIDSGKRQIKQLIERGVNITAFGGDGAFDNISLWRFLENRHIRPIIKPHKNALSDSASPSRNSNVKYRSKYGYRKWARRNKYGYRWPATEGLFSAIKRMFGEQLSARSEIGMIQEASIKVWGYQVIKRYGQG